MKNVSLIVGIFVLIFARNTYAILEEAFVAFLMLTNRVPVTEIVTRVPVTEITGSTYVGKQGILEHCLQQHVESPWFEQNGVIAQAARLFGSQNRVQPDALRRQSQNLVINQLLQVNTSQYIVGLTDDLYAAAMTCHTGVRQNRKPLHKKSERERRQGMGKKHG